MDPCWPMQFTDTHVTRPQFSKPDIVLNGIICGIPMIGSCLGITFRIAGPLWRESTRQLWVDSPQKGPVMGSFAIFFIDSLNEAFEKKIELLVIYDTVRIMWRHCNRDCRGSFSSSLSESAACTVSLVLSVVIFVLWRDLYVMISTT